MPDQKRTQQDKLIEALYDLAINPNNFDSFTQTWDQYIVDHQLNNDSAEIPQRLSRHFARAFHILEKFGREHLAQTHNVEQFIQTRETPAMAITIDGRLVSINQPAEKLLKPDANTEFARDLLHARSGEQLKRGLSRILSTDTPLPIMVLLPDSQPALMVMQRLTDSNTVVLDISGSSWSDSVHETLKSMYQLTDRECEVAALLYQGLSLNEIAELEHRNLETLRKHTKSILKKTQTHSQPKLMRLLTSLNFAKADNSQPRWLNSLCENHVLKLDDGRDLAYYDTGGTNQKATPRVIVVLHGVLNDPELPASMQNVLLAEGYRIVGISRAWFGQSSAPPMQVDLINNAAADLMSVLDHLNITKAVLLGLAAGSLYAYATSVLHPERVERIICIAGMVPITDDTQIRAMPKGIRSVVYTAKYFPKLLPVLIRTAVAVVDNGNIRSLFDSTYKNSPIDLAASKREDIFERLCKGYRFAQHHGHTAYTNEGVAISKNMSQYMNQLNCPIILLHGRHDGLVTMKSVCKLAQQHNNMQLQIVEDAGHLMIYTLSDSVTEQLMLALGSS